ncbi:unnamed protein product [Cyprideis torosa]|uniref:Uncharacterized protein n=1 Tax=Cyprideis torosa TaxID=163714 RepID=A0A7R8ZQF7_9CRUS|nr:unnamed protein product [Cyprideis torosa]CAG0901265.1 unnamed protein product [Cyprideis torosa]
MDSLLFGFFLALAVVATIDGALDLPSNDRSKIPVNEGPNPAPVELVCPAGFFVLGDSCYAVFDDYTDRRSWDDSQTFCGSLAPGGRLVELETAQEIDLVKNHLADNTRYSCSWYWLGGDEVGDSNIFKWASTGQMIDASDWLPGQPNGSGSGDAISLYCGYWLPGMPNGSGSGDAISLYCGSNWQWMDFSKPSSVALQICEAPLVQV